MTRMRIPNLDWHRWRSSDGTGKEMIPVVSLRPKGLMRRRRRLETLCRFSSRDSGLPFAPERARRPPGTPASGGKTASSCCPHGDAGGAGGEGAGEGGAGCTQSPGLALGPASRTAGARRIGEGEQLPPNDAGGRVRVGMGRMTKRMSPECPVETPGRGGDEEGDLQEPGGGGGDCGVGVAGDEVRDGSRERWRSRRGCSRDCADFLETDLI